MIKDTETILLEDKFYADRYHISYSAMSKLLYSPYLFYKHYVLGQREDEQTVATLAGKVVHCLLLDSDNFNKQFILLPGNLPSDNPKKIIEAVYEHHTNQPATTSESEEVVTLTHYKDYILAALVEANLYQTLKTDQQRLDKIITPSHEEYFGFLVKKNGKDIVDIPTYDECLAIVEQLKSDTQVTDLLGMSNTNETSQVLNELMLSVDTVEGLSFGIKGVLDNLVIDTENKYIRINDIKKTSKTLSEFPDTVEFYNYWIQASLYNLMVKKEFLENNNIDSKDWTIDFNFIVIDKYKQVYPFKVSAKTMEEWTVRLEEVLQICNWHYENRNFNLPYKLANGSFLL
jgi:hypothetical protein